MIVALAAAPVIILLLSAGVLVALRFVRARLGTHWLVASGGALLAWGAVFWQRSLIPNSIPIVAWLPDVVYAYSPVLVFDHLAWTYAIALVTLCLSVILTDVAQPERIEWAEWSGSLLLTGLGLLAILAGNPMTMLLAWAAIDLAEMAILMSQFEDRARRSQIVVGFAIRLVALGLLAWAAILAAGGGVRLVFDAIPPEIRVFLLIAGGVRLGVLQLHRSHLADINERKSLGTMSGLVAGAAGLAPVLHVARNGGLETGLANPLLLIGSLLGLFAGIAWLRSADELQARPAWFLSTGVLALAAAILGRPQPAAAWGLTMLLSGGVLFLFTTRRRLMLLLPGLALLSLATIPFAPGWGGALLYSDGFPLRLAPFIIIQSLLCVGYIRHASRPEPGIETPERWVWAVYPWGLAMLPVVHGLVFWLAEIPSLSLSTVWPSLVVLALSAAWFTIPRLIFVSAFLERLGLSARDITFPQISFGWLGRFLRAIYRLFGSSFEVVARLMEGEGGVIWALLILVLLVAIVLQVNPVGGV